MISPLDAVAEELYCLGTHAWVHSAAESDLVNSRVRRIVTDVCEGEGIELVKLVSILPIESSTRFTLWTASTQRCCVYECALSNDADKAAKLLRVLDLGDNVVAFVPLKQCSSNTIAIVGRSYVKLWHVIHGGPDACWRTEPSTVWTLPSSSFPGAVLTAAALTDDGRYLALAAGRYVFILYRAQEGACEWSCTSLDMHAVEPGVSVSLLAWDHAPAVAPKAIDPLQQLSELRGQSYGTFRSALLSVSTRWTGREALSPGSTRGPHTGPAEMSGHGKSVHVFRESEVWKTVSFQHVHSTTTATAAADGCVMSHCWVQPLMQHDRLHWGWHTQTVDGRVALLPPEPLILQPPQLLSVPQVYDRLCGTADDACSGVTDDGTTNGAGGSLALPRSTQQKVVIDYGPVPTPKMIIGKTYADRQGGEKGVQTPGKGGVFLSAAALSSVPADTSKASAQSVDHAWPGCMHTTTASAGEAALQGPALAAKLLGAVLADCPAAHDNRDSLTRHLLEMTVRLTTGKGVFRTHTTLDSLSLDITSVSGYSNAPVKRNACCTHTHSLVLEASSVEDAVRTAFDRMHEQRAGPGTVHILSMAASTCIAKHECTVAGHSIPSAPCVSGTSDVAVSSDEGVPEEHNITAQFVAVADLDEHGARLRSRVASAAASAAAVHCMDTCVATSMNSGPTTDTGGTPRQHRSAGTSRTAELPRSAHRSGRRGICAELHASSLPSAITLICSVAFKAVSGPSTGSSSLSVVVVRQEDIKEVEQAPLQHAVIAFDIDLDRGCITSARILHTTVPPAPVPSKPIVSDSAQDRAAKQHRLTLLHPDQIEETLWSGPNRSYSPHAASLLLGALASTVRRTVGLGKTMVDDYVHKWLEAAPNADAVSQQASCMRDMVAAGAFKGVSSTAESAPGPVSVNLPYMAVLPPSPLPSTVFTLAKSLAHRPVIGESVKAEQSVEVEPTFASADDWDVPSKPVHGGDDMDEHAYSYIASQPLRASPSDESSVQDRDIHSLALYWQIQHSAAATLASSVQGKGLAMDDLLFSVPSSSSASTITAVSDSPPSVDDWESGHEKSSESPEGQTSTSDCLRLMTKEDVDLLREALTDSRLTFHGLHQPTIPTGMVSQERVLLAALASVLYELHATPSGDVAALDGPGLRFILCVKVQQAVAALQLRRRAQDRQTDKDTDRVIEAATVPMSAVYWALQSEAQDAILRLSLPPVAHGLTWQQLNTLAIPLWLHSDAALGVLMERLAKTEYARAERDPYAAVLPYLCLGKDKLSVLRSLFRLSPVSAHAKVASFLGNDFYDPGSEGDKFRKSAGKNAFALMGQHKYEAAAGFFLLAGRPGQAVKTLLQHLKQPAQALAVARLAAKSRVSSLDSSVAPLVRRIDSFGALDAQSLLKDAGAELLRLARGQSEDNGSNSSHAKEAGVAGVSQKPSSPISRPMHGFGFADDNDHDEHSTERSHVTLSPETTAAEASGTAHNTAVEAEDGMRRSVLPDAEVDPVAYVLACGFDWSSGARLSGAGSHLAHAVLLWLQGKTIDSIQAVAEAAQVRLGDDCALSSPQPVSDAERQAVDLLSVMLTGAGIRRGAVLRVLASRLGMSTEASLRMPEAEIQALLAARVQVRLHLSALAVGINIFLPPSLAQDAHQVVDTIASHVDRIAWLTVHGRGDDVHRLRDAAQYCDCLSAWLRTQAPYSDPLIGPHALMHAVLESDEVVAVGARGTDDRLATLLQRSSFLLQRTLRVSPPVQTPTRVAEAAAEQTGTSDPPPGNALSCLHAHMAAHFSRVVTILCIEVHKDSQSGFNGASLSLVREACLHCWLHTCLWAITQGPAASSRLKTGLQLGMDLWQPSELKIASVSAIARLCAFVCAEFCKWRLQGHTARRSVSSAEPATMQLPVHAAGRQALVMIRQEDEGQLPSTGFDLNAFLDVLLCAYMSTAVSATILTHVRRATRSMAGAHHNRSRNVLECARQWSEFWSSALASHRAISVPLEQQGLVRAHAGGNIWSLPQRRSPRYTIMTSLFGASEQAKVATGNAVLPGVPVVESVHVIERIVPVMGAGGGGGAHSSTDWESQQQSEVTIQVEENAALEAGTSSSKVPHRHLPAPLHGQRPLAASGQAVGKPILPRIDTSGLSHDSRDVRGKAAMGPALSAVLAKESSSDLPWWSDAGLLFGCQATGRTLDLSHSRTGEEVQRHSAAQNVAELWVYLGGPGFLWTLSMERRALIRAESNGGHGYLPTLKPTAHLLLRAPSSSQPVLGTCAIRALFAQGPGRTQLMMSAYGASVQSVHTGLRTAAVGSSAAAPASAIPTHVRNASLFSDTGSAAFSPSGSGMAVRMSQSASLTANPPTGSTNLEASGMPRPVPAPPTPSSLSSTAAQARAIGEAAMRSLVASMTPASSPSGASRRASSSLGIHAPDSAPSAGEAPTNVTRVLLYIDSEEQASTTGGDTPSIDSALTPLPDTPGSALHPVNALRSKGSSAVAVGTGAVLTLDQHMYTAPFTQSPDAMCAHPHQPVYARAGPGGTVATVDVSLASQCDSSTGHGPSQSSQAVVHTLCAVYGYEPLETVGGRGLEISSTARGGFSAMVGSLLGSNGLAPLGSTTMPGHRTGHSTNTAGLLMHSAAVAGRCVLHWDEHSTRVRWTADGSHLLVCFASGIVRSWEVGNTARPTVTLQLPAQRGPGLPSASTKEQPLALTMGIDGHCSWAATDVCSLTGNGAVLAISGAPAFTAPAVHDLCHRLAATAARTAPAGVHTTPAAVSAAVNAFGTLPHANSLSVYDLRVGSSAPIWSGLPFPGHPGLCTLMHDEAAFTLVCGCEDGAVLLWDLRRLRVRVQIPGVPIVGSNMPRTPTPGSKGSAHDLLAVVGADGADAQEISHYGHAGAVTALAMHPNGRMFGSGGQDGDVRMWSLPQPVHVMGLSRVHAPRPLTASAGAQSTRKGPLSGLSLSSSSGELDTLGAGPHMSRRSSTIAPPSQQSQQHGQALLGLPRPIALTHGADSSIVAAIPHQLTGLHWDAGAWAESIILSRSAPSGSLTSMNPSQSIFQPPSLHPHTQSQAVYSHGSPWGVSSLYINEEHVVSTGYDGAVRAHYQVW